MTHVYAVFLRVGRRSGNAPDDSVYVFARDKRIPLALPAAEVWTKDGRGDALRAHTGKVGNVNPKSGKLRSWRATDRRMWRKAIRGLTAGSES